MVDPARRADDRGRADDPPVHGHVHGLRHRVPRDTGRAEGGAAGERGRTSRHAGGAGGGARTGAREEGEGAVTTTLIAEAVRGMGAGRQLDALVAEHVMGWRGRRHGVHWPEGYSTGPAAAMQVVATMRAAGWICTYDDDGKPCAGFYRHKDSEGYEVGSVAATGRDFCECVCRAALLTVLEPAP